MYRSLIPFIAFLLTACGNAYQDYFPLTENWNWRYRITRSTSDGITKQKYVIKNLPVQEIAGAKVIPRITLTGNVYFYRQTLDGVRRVATQLTSNGVLTNKPNHLVMPSNVTLGATWRQTTVTSVLEKTGPPQRTEYRIIVPLEIHNTIESLNDQVQVPAGNFHRCIRIKGIGSTNVDAANYVGHTSIEVENFDWYAPGIGLIKTIRKEKIGSTAIKPGEYILELEALSRN